MAVYSEGEMVRTRLYDEVFVDYLWYRTCEINGYTECRVPSNAELEDKLQRACMTDASKIFMETYNHRSNDSNRIDKWISTLACEFEKKCLTKKDFNWLDEQYTRLHCYIWRLMSHLECIDSGQGLFGHKEYQCTLNINIQAFNAKHFVKMDGIYNNAVTKKNIIHLINRLPNAKHDKLKLIKDIQKYTEHALQNQQVVSWFKDESNKKATWLYDYLHTLNLGYTPLVMPRSSGVKNDIISFLDVLCIVNDDRFKLLVINFKKAWSQRKYRENNKTKKQYSINMSHDIGDILDEICTKRNENKNSIVENLIRAEYAKISSS